MRISHRWAIAAASMLLLGATSACGHQDQPSPAAHARPVAARSAVPHTAPSSAAGAHASRAHQRHHSVGDRAGRGRKPVARHDWPSGGSPTSGPQLAAGSYDDTSGTTARPPRSQKKVLATLPGKGAGGCVQVGGRADVRSGRLAMGNFAQARSTYHQNKGAYDAPPSFFYVIPQLRGVHRVSVTLTRVDGHGTPVKVQSRQVEEAAQWKYFPVSVAIPAPGTWRFSVSSGSAHGCFEADFRA